MYRLEKILLSPNPILRRSLFKYIFRLFWKTEQKIELNLFKRTHYAYCLYWAAKQAKALGHNSFSAIEFGVAKGDGLLLLEKYSKTISKELDINIQIYGFDSSKGLPPAEDYKDMPFIWKKGLFKMDYPAL